MRTFLRIWQALTALVILAVIVLVVLIAGVRLVGLRPFVVVSGSMEPEYKVGSLLYVGKASPDEIEVGDVITFIMNKNLDVATHRVVDIDENAEYFYTKGDANDEADTEPVYYKNIIGVPVFSIPLLGYLTTALSTPRGVIIAAAVVLVLIILSFVPELVRGDRRRPLTKRERRRK